MWGVVRRSKAKQGEARHGKQGVAGGGEARQGEARQARRSRRAGAGRGEGKRGGARRGGKKRSEAGWGGSGECKNMSSSKTESADPAVNGPTSLSASDASIASNLQAMSTQLFQTKRCFRLAPTFSNILLKPSGEQPASKGGLEGKPCINGDVEKPGLAEQGKDPHAALPHQKLHACGSLLAECSFLSGRGAV